MDIMNENRIAGKMFVKVLIAFALLLLLSPSAKAESSAEPVSTNGWFTSGGATLKVYQIKNGSKVLYTSGKIDISRASAPDLEESKTRAYDWDVKFTGTNGNISVSSGKISSRNGVSFSDPYYHDEAEYTWAGYYGFLMDVNIAFPKGYRYQNGSQKTDTKERDSEGLHKRAMKLYLPKSIYDSFYASNETRKSTLVIHGTNLGILSLENM